MTSRLVPRPASDGGSSDASPGTLPDRMPVLILYAHSRCNCRCVMCDIWRDPAHASLPPALVAREAPAWREAGVERVVLSGGEPLMHPDLWGLVGPLRAQGFGITLLSTGLLLEANAGPVAEHIDDVVVSLDGPAPVHDAIRRVPGAYRALTDGVAAVRRAANAAGTTPRITARCTVQRANCRTLTETVSAARDAGLDQISFLAADLTSEAFNRPGGWSPERQMDVGLGPDDLAALEQELVRLEAECATERAAGFIAESPEKLQRIADAFAFHLGLRPPTPARCNAPWVSAVVEADGTVRPCFFHAPIGRWQVAGGADTEGLLDVVRGERATSFRKTLDVASNPICQRCTCRLNLDTSRSVP